LSCLFVKFLWVSHEVWVLLDVYVYVYFGFISVLASARIFKGRPRISEWAFYLVDGIVDSELRYSWAISSLSVCVSLNV
jgi:hypothetical protein